MRTLILGIGNTILRDDGIGPAITRELSQRCFSQDVHFEATNLAGMALLDIITGYENLIIIDAMQGNGHPGDINWFSPEDFALADNHYSSQHKIGILQALELGASLNMPVPARVKLLAIEATDVTSFGEELTPEVAAAIPAAIRMVMHELALLQDCCTYPAAGGETPPAPRYRTLDHTN